MTEPPAVHHHEPRGRLPLRPRRHHGLRRLPRSPYAPRHGLRLRVGHRDRCTHRALAVNLANVPSRTCWVKPSVTAQALGRSFDSSSLAPGSRDQLTRQAERYSEQIDGRVLVMDDDGVVLADANPFPVPADSAVGEDYATVQRPEVERARRRPTVGPRADQRRTGDRPVAGLSPIVDDPDGRPAIIGAVRITLDVQRERLGPARDGRRDRDRGSPG